MRKVWIVAADGCKARVFCAENVTTLKEVTNMLHPESRLPSRELVSDKPGRGTQLKSGYPRAMQADSSPKQNEKDHFAEKLAHFLEESCNKGEFERLYLIVSTQFSGLLHAHLHQNVKKLIVQEIHKDLTMMKPEEIRNYLPPVL